MKKWNKEKVYDEEISPLMKQIIDICKREEIPFFCEFEYAKNKFCKSASTFDGHMAITMYDIMSQCKEKNGINMDKFILTINKNYKNTSSVFLEMTGNAIDRINPSKS